MSAILGKLKEKLSEYVKEIPAHKIRCVFAVITAITLFSISCIYLFNGINKRFILFSVLCFLCGVLLVLPSPSNPYLSGIVIISYLAFIPKKMFVRIELPNHDMSHLMPGTVLANTLIILLFFAIILLLTQSFHFAFGIGSIALLILFLINYYVTLFRGFGISINDLAATGTAMGVINNYRLSMNSELWYSILYFCFFILLGFWCRFPVKKKKMAKMIYHITITATGIAYLLFFHVFWNYSGYLEKHDLHGNYWNLSENQPINGFLLSFGIGMKENSMEKPSGYSQKALNELAESIENMQVSHTSSEEISPNIILIMNEAWSDLSVLGNLETTEAYMPFADSLTENTARGNLHVNIVGGLTANTEFEVLTGDALAFLPSHCIPYQQQVNHDIASLATILREQGYQTLAIHPSGGNAWNRERAYRNMGFEEFVDIQNFLTEYKYVGNFISDECNFNEIIAQFENKKEDAPLFLFNVTIQNHADYYGQVELPIEITRVGNTDAKDIPYTYDLQTYLNLMKITDDAFQNLIAYFKTVNEPTIICMFGDHQPNLHYDFYQSVFADQALSEEEKSRLRFEVPYIIWSNYENDFNEYGDMSANFLGAAVLECANAQLPPYYSFLLDLQKEYPIISHLGCSDAYGNIYQVTDLEDNESLLKYRKLQYNHLIDKNSIKALFSIKQ